MGRAGIAYSDTDTARYQYATPESPSAGNRGRQYRNDGVDIYRDIKSNDTIYYVGAIEDGEWLQYTAVIEEEGEYLIQVRVASRDNNGRISLTINGKPALNFTITKTGEVQEWQTIGDQKVTLKKGVNQLVIKAEKGGFNLHSIQFQKR